MTEEDQYDFVQLASYYKRSILKTYETIKHDRILRADFLRYLILLVEGGVYTDIDTRPVRPIQDWVPPELLNRTNIVLGVESDKGVGVVWKGLPWKVSIAQFTIMAKPQHPLIRRVVETVQDSVGHFVAQRATEAGLPRLFFEDVDNLTGPRLFTNVVFQYLSDVTGLQMNGDEISGALEPVLVDDVLILPVNAFASGQLHSNSGTSDSKTALVSHRWMSSWVPTHPHRPSEDVH